MMYQKIYQLLVPLLLSFFATAQARVLQNSAKSTAEEVSKVNAEDVGVTIMGQIINKDADSNVALIKEEGGVVKAVKSGHIINKKYKVLAVTAKFLEVIDRKGMRMYVYQSKFAETKPGMSLAAKTPPSLSRAEQNYYQEEGFERKEGNIKMTAAYRDQVVKRDLAKVLMQATAEPYMEGGQIVGFKMSQIDVDSIYDKSGLRNDDIVTAINGTELNSVAGAISLLKSLKGADSLDVTVRRGGSVVDFAISVQ